MNEQPLSFLPWNQFPAQGRQSQLIDALPHSSDLRNFVQYTAHHLQVPEDMVMLNVLGAINTAINGHFEVRIQNGQSEPLCLYLIIIASPGDRKSATVKSATAPIRDWLDRQYQALADASAAPHEPPPRLYFSDATAAALKVALAGNGGRLSCHDAEPELLGILSDKRFPKSLVCRAYDREEIVMDRARKAPIRIPNPAISICVSAQPEMAFRFLRDHDVRSSGLVGRFLFGAFPALAGSRLVGAPPVPLESARYYDIMVKRLLDISLTLPGQPHILRLDNQAEREFFDFGRKAEEELAPGRSLSFDVGWGSKLPGKVLRLAGLLHCALHTNPRNSPISAQTIAQAVAMAMVFIRHARHVIHLADHGEAHEIAGEIERWAIQYAASSFSVGDLQSGLFRRSRKEVAAGLEVLLRTRRVVEDLPGYSDQNGRFKRGRNRGPLYRLATPFIYG